RFVTWTIEACIGATERRALSSEAPSSTAAQTRPVPPEVRAFDTSRPYDWIRSDVTDSLRSIGSIDGVLSKRGASARTVGIRSSALIGDAHRFTPNRFRA